MKQKPEPFFPPPKFDDGVKEGMVKVIRPDLATGEVVKDVVPATAYSKPTPQRGTEDDAPDPLAGQREAINNSEIEYLLFDDEGKGCPVKPGDIFKLRSCHIEITRCHRVQAKSVWKWRAEFRRQYPEPQRHLRRNGGYTTSTFLGVPDPETNTEPESVPRDFQRRISEQAAIANALAQSRAKTRSEKMELEAKLARMRPRGRRDTIVALETRIDRLSNRDDAA